MPVLTGADRKVGNAYSGIKYSPRLLCRKATAPCIAKKKRSAPYHQADSSRIPFKHPRDKKVVWTYAEDGDASHHTGVLGRRKLLVDVREKSPALRTPTGGLDNDALLWRHIGRKMLRVRLRFVWEVMVECRLSVLVKVEASMMMSNKFRRSFPRSELRSWHDWASVQSFNGDDEGR